MLIVLSPAKSLDYESPLATQKVSQPTMLDHSEELVGVMVGKSPNTLSKMMGISPQLAELNFERFQNWERPFTTETARQALLAFDGDVYMGLDAKSFNQRDFTHAQKTLRILSGLYGLLRPLDLIMPYRLEMGSKLKTKRGKDLYGFWGEHITNELNAAMAASPGEDVLVNLASNEYFKSVRTDVLEAPVVTPAFLDAKGTGDFKTISFFAKKARGSMAAWIIKDRVKKVAEFEDFGGMGYSFDPTRSTESRPVFTRRNPA
ncbi:MAG: peroxide stress protein YaaA [Acidimicrobiales bacterium]